MFGERRGRRPSIFDMLNDLTRGFPFDIGERGEGAEEDWFTSSFEDMIRDLQERTPEEYSDLVREERTPGGVSRRYGPFVYGFSCTAEPGKEPVFREFGNVRPTERGVEPSMGREPLVDVMDEKDKFRVFVELPGVEKEDIKVDAADQSIEISTTDAKKFYKMVDLDATINPDSVKASYKNGVLTIEAEKKEKRVGKEVKVD